MDQTIQVLDLSPKVTLNDLDTFFSYCGTVDKIILERKQDQSQLAYVTFRQPYALQTALLLNDAVIVDHRVRILSLRNMESLPIFRVNNVTKNNEKQGLIPVAHSLVQVMASIGCENLNKAKDVLDERYKLSEKSTVLTQQTKMAITAVEQTVGRVGEAILNNGHVSAGALWLTTAFDKATKCAAELGGHDKKKDSDTRKQI